MKYQLLAIGIVLAVVTACGTAGSSRQAVSPPISRDQAVNSASARTNVALRVDRIEAKLSTWAEVQKANGPAQQTFAAIDPAQLVWVVAIGGDFVPQLSRGERFTWGAFLFNADTGEEEATLAGTDGVWPPFFLLLDDLAD